AFQAAWTYACKHTGGSTFVVPRGEFLVGPISFCGPCNKSPNVEIRGTLKAPPNPSAFKEPIWLEFRDLSSVNITGAGPWSCVGSLGKYPNEEDVNRVHVQNCTLIGTDNGVRVKSWSGSPPSKASNLKFEDIIMTNVKNPIILDQEYCPGKGKGCQTKVKISDVLFKKIKGTGTTKSESNFGVQFKYAL
ncbi:hypothetical protein IFM89_017020, partial [Coptis chinensis]